MDSLWYKDAIFYELHVRTFSDSNADGTGDFAGARQKLDYLQDLGITCIWLLPFYQSPLRDDGYDVSDYYQFEREGTTSENLPETHAYFKELRRELDRAYPGCILLAEANQGPADLCTYFGDGDEFHLAFHFPLMPRLFLALRREERRSIVDILNQTFPIPHTCQWLTFLRNHDEMTLARVTDEEREYLFREYAREPQMRLNNGIRRRLAPLLANDRRLTDFAGLSF
jgi:glycosidase